MGDDLHAQRRDAAAFVIAWLAESPATTRLAAAAKVCNWQVEEVDEIIKWIVDQPHCSAEIVLHLLDRFGVTSADEEGLRVEEQSFQLCERMVQGLRVGKFKWTSSPRRDRREISEAVAVESWRDVEALAYCDMYGDLVVDNIPESVKDAFEMLGVGFGDRVAKAARQTLIDKGFDPDDL